MRIKICFAMMLVIFLVGCSDDKYDELAKCMTGKEVKMYGAFWCPHCNTQKEMFGSSFEHINYIECSTPDRTETKVCVDADIESYPTWEFSDGSRLKGVQSIEALSQKSGCGMGE